MKRLIALTVAAVMSLTFFSPCLQAAEWDTDNPPLYPWKATDLTQRSGGDDDPFGIDKNQERGFAWMNLISEFLAEIEVVWCDLACGPSLAVGSSRGTIDSPVGQDPCGLDVL